VDVLFQSAAKTYGRRVLGVIMTGMGNDGTQGAAWVKAQGGMILTESEESCIIYGMPRCVVEAGLSDEAVAIAAMAREINNRV
jgi:two-component system chemotaxis response regulator CheB